MDSINTPFKSVSRLVLSSTFNKNQIALLYTEIFPYISQLTEEEFTLLINKAKNEYGLRTAPLLLAIIALKEKKLKNAQVVFESLITQTNLLQTALSIYQIVNNSLKPIAAPLKKALRNKLLSFSEYNIIKGNTSVSGISLRDVVLLTHPKPISEESSLLIKKILENNLPVLDSWETVISSCKTSIDKQMEWERLLLDGRLQNITLLRNIKNLLSNEVNLNLITEAIAEIDINKITMFQILVAAIANKNQPQIAKALSTLACSNFKTILCGNTLIGLDLSGSMHGQVRANSYSGSSRLTLLDIGSMLTYLVARSTEKCVVAFTAGNHSVTGAHAVCELDLKTCSYLEFRREVLRAEAILGRGGIFTHQFLQWAGTTIPEEFDRIVVISDSADCGDKNLVAKPTSKYSYLLDISHSRNNIIINDNWTAEINGWSDNIPMLLSQYEQF